MPYVYSLTCPGLSGMPIAVPAACGLRLPGPRDLCRHSRLRGVPGGVEVVLVPEDGSSYRGKHRRAAAGAFQHPDHQRAPRRGLRLPRTAREPPTLELHAQPHRADLPRPDRGRIHLPPDPHDPAPGRGAPPRRQVRPPTLLTMDGDFGPFSGTTTSRLTPLDDHTTQLVRRIPGHNSQAYGNGKDLFCPS